MTLLPEINPFKDAMHLSQFTAKVLSLHIEKKSYLLENGKLEFRSIFKPTPYDKMISAKSLLQASMCATKKFGFSNEDVRKLACCAYQAVKEMDKLQQVDSYTMKNAYRNLMGMGELASIPEQLDKLIQSNHLHYKINRLGIGPYPFSQIPSGNNYQASILVAGLWIAFSELRIEPLEKGFDFKKDGKLLFKTDCNYQLSGYFFCGIQGIIPGMATEIGMKEGVVKGTHPKEAPDGKYHLIIGTATSSKTAPKLKGNHSYLGLIDPEGNKTFFGQFGILEKVDCGDVPTMCARKKAGIESPDRYTGLPYTGYHILETKLEITKAKYDLIHSSAVHDIAEGREGSMMEDNCTGYVKTTLAKANIEVETAMTPTVWFYRWLLPKIFPESFSESLIELGRKLPAIITFFLHYLTPIYPVQIFFGLGQTLTSFEWKKGWENLENFNTVFRAIFFPWRYFINEPLALRDWQQRQKQ